MNQGIRVIRVAVAAAALPGSCFSAQIYPTVKERNISLQPRDLETHGIAFITPEAAEWWEHAAPISHL